MRWIDRLETIVLFLLLSFLYYFTLPVHTPKNIRLTGDSIDSIIAELQNKSVEVGRIDRWILGRLAPPQKGWIYLGKNRMNRLEFLSEITSPANRFKPVTLIPGETTVIFLDQLAKSLERNATKLRRAFSQLSPYPEAGILAESYNVPLRYDEKRIINYLLNLTRRRYRALAREAGIPYEPKRWLRILTVASIIQKEAANRREMPLVASVIYNRLRKKMRLQMDGTLNYGRYSHLRVTPERIRDDNSTYNTYRHRGLPAAPVCNVSAAAIHAALHPAKTDYLYFFRNDRGTHDFFKTYKAHLKEVHKKRRELEKEKKKAGNHSSKSAPKSFSSKSSRSSS